VLNQLTWKKVHPVSVFIVVKKPKISGTSARRI